MDIFNIVPIELHGMSVITALVLCFVFAAAVCYFWWDRREHTYAHERIEDVDSKVDLLFAKVDDANGDIGDMKQHMAGIHEAVEWIKKYMEDRK